MTLKITGLNQKRKNGEKLKSPTLIEKYIKNHFNGENSTEMKWVPLYIGKSKTLKSRIKEHLNDPLETTRGGLKIGKRDFLKGKTIRISVIEFDSKIENYDVIAPYIENMKRNDLNPIIGKQ